MGRDSLCCPPLSGSCKAFEGVLAEWTPSVTAGEAGGGAGIRLLSSKPVFCQVSLGSCETLREPVTASVMDVFFTDCQQVWSQHKLQIRSDTLMEAKQEALLVAQLGWRRMWELREQRTMKREVSRPRYW